MNSKTKHIPVRLSGLADGAHELQYDVEPQLLDLPEQFVSPVHVDIHLDKGQHQVALRVSVHAEAQYPCDRCLDAVAVPVDTEFVLVYTHDNSGPSSEDDSVRPIDVSDPTVDISEDVRDAALLCIPMRIICGEDEQGAALCRQPIPEELRAEAQQREDPRWDKLKSLNLEQ